MWCSLVRRTTPVVCLDLQERSGKPPNVWMQLEGFDRPIDPEEPETSTSWGWSDPWPDEESDADNGASGPGASEDASEDA